MSWWRDLSGDEKARRLDQARPLFRGLGWKETSARTGIPRDVLRRAFDEAWRAKRCEQINRQRQGQPSRAKAAEPRPSRQRPGAVFVSASGVEAVSRFVPNRNSGHSSPAHPFVAISLPRLRCLEKEPLS